MPPTVPSHVPQPACACCMSIKERPARFAPVLQPLARRTTLAMRGTLGRTL